MASRSGTAQVKTPLRPVLNLNLRIFAVPLFYGLLVVAPLARGLYFPADRMPFHMASAVLFALLYLDKLNRRDRQLMVSPVDYLVLGLAACYSISFFVAVDKLAAFYAALNYANYFMIYWVAADLCRDARYGVKILRVLFISGVFVVLVGLGAAVNVIPFPGAYASGRIMSTFQYANALASYVMATGIICLGLWANEESSFWKLVYAAGNFLFIITILGTYSRGVWLLYPLGVMLLALGLKGERVWRVAFGFLWGLAACMVVLRPLFEMLGAQRPLATAKYVVFGLLLVLAGQVVYDLILAALRRFRVHRRTRRLVLVGLVAYLCIVGASYLIYISRVYVSPTQELLPGSVVQRSETITIDTHSAAVRLMATQDALKIVGTRPIIGAGGGGWNALYHQHQTILYWMSEAHNHFAQLWVEVGTLGLLVYLAFWAGVLHLGYRLLRSPEEETPPMAWVAVATAVTYGLHSAIEFQLSLAGAAVLLWVVAGVAFGTPGPQLRVKLPRRLRVPEKAGRALQLGTAGFLAVAVLVLSTRANLAGNVGTHAALALRQHDFQWARDLYLEAVRLNPFSAAYRGDLAYAYTALGLLRESEEDIARGVEELEAARRLQGYDLVIRQRLADILLLKGDWIGALEERRAIIALVPLDLRSYEVYATLVIQVVPLLLRNGQVEEALDHLESMVALEAELAGRQAAIPERAHQYWPPRRLDPSPTLRLRLGQAHYLLGEWEQAVDRLVAARRDSKLRDESDLWRAAALARQGNAQEATQILGRLSPQLASAFEDVVLLGAVLTEANVRRSVD